VIPAVASTNAIISAACAAEVLKIVSMCSQTLYTYMMYAGNTGVYGYTSNLEKKEDCVVCGSTKRTFSVQRSMTLKSFIEQYLVGSELRMKAPSMAMPNKVLYMQVLSAGTTRFTITIVTSLLVSLSCATLRL
jgi:NEDD8-activating enzyme E1